MEYTHRTYWALLDCGHRLSPTAGTATGVHPVPLGFGRVYVNLPGGFSYDEWMKGLAAGKSFVTTGPMLICERGETDIRGTVLSLQKELDAEIIVNGTIVEKFQIVGTSSPKGGWEGTFQKELKVNSTHWVAVRVWERAPEAPGTDRWRFAHSAPVWRDVPGQLLRPRREEAEFLIERVRNELNRSRDVLPPAAIEEYQTALSKYEATLK
jgi:hypothetical protein